VTTESKKVLVVSSETCNACNKVSTFVDILLTVHLSIVISVINQPDAQTFCFTISSFHASTCFEHMFSSSGQNCITQPQVSSHLKVAVSCTGWEMMIPEVVYCKFWPDDEHMCSKHVQAWNKLIVKQNFCASSWLITEIKLLESVRFT